MFYKIKDVKIISQYQLLVSFQNGTRKIYNVKNWIEKYKIFEPLSKDEKFFKNVKVDLGGYGISWNDDIDISCNELWDNGVEVDNKLYAVCEDSEDYDANK